MPKKIDNSSVYSVGGKTTDIGWEREKSRRDKIRAMLAVEFPEMFPQYRDITDKYDATFVADIFPNIIPGGGEFTRKRKGINMPSKTTIVSFNSVSGKRGRKAEFPDSVLPDWTFNIGENLDITDDMFERMEVETIEDILSDENKDIRKNAIDAFKRVMKRANGENSAYEFGIADTEIGQRFVVVRNKDSAKSAK